MQYLKSELHYRLEDTPNKVKPAPNIKIHTNETRQVWALLQEAGLQFFGVVRHWRTIVGTGGTYLVLPPLYGETPIEELFGTESGYTYTQIPMGGPIEDDLSCEVINADRL
ncbi:hypothetical protein EHV15_35685 [Paenibacillus oralis]|uniref:Uncharacterized protein n=1 Tax=Paenibacillus oralis TaxID=2490856 RepID=A0A3P3TA30_9BACL|nr:hypothetical protein [Paenibacillus oralis]RRJ54915.1 hypothetical protein EHV15_35685 [Paenibacillus oralis]